MICASCSIEGAASRYAFWCVLGAEVRRVAADGDRNYTTLGQVRTFSFEAPVCDRCIEARRQRNKRRILVGGICAYLALAVVIVAALRSPEAMGILLFGLVPVFVLFWSLWKVIGNPSRTGTVLAIEARRADLTRDGYSGFWVTEPERVTVD